MSRMIQHKIGPHNRITFSSEAEYALFLQGRNSPPVEVFGPEGVAGNRGIDGNSGPDGEPGPVGADWSHLFGNANGICPLDDDGLIPSEYLPAAWSGIAGGSAPAGALVEIKSAAISLTANFTGSATRVTYSNKLHDEAGFVDAQEAAGFLKIPADYGQCWVQPSYYFESGAISNQRVASLVQVVGTTETVLTGYRNILVANGLKGTSFRGTWILTQPGTKFYVAYSNATGSNSMSAGAWFQIEVRKVV